MGKNHSRAIPKALNSTSTSFGGARIYKGSDRKVKEGKYLLFVMSQNSS